MGGIAAHRRRASASPSSWPACSRARARWSPASASSSSTSSRPGAKDLMVGLFGTNDKLALEVIIVDRRRWRSAPASGSSPAATMGLASIGFALFGVVGFLATLRDPLASAPITAVSAAISVAIGIWVLGWLIGPRRGDAPRRVVGPTARAAMPDWSRRSFLRPRRRRRPSPAWSAGLAGRALLERQQPLPAGGGQHDPAGVRDRARPRTRSGPGADGRRADPDRDAEPTASTGSTPRCWSRSSTPRTGRCASTASWTARRP